MIKQRQIIVLEVDQITEREKRKWRDILRATERKRAKVEQTLRGMGKLQIQSSSESIQDMRPTSSNMSSPLLTAQKSFKLIALDAICRKKGKHAIHSEQGENGQNIVNTGPTEKIKLQHPMEILSRVAGSSDPQDILAKFEQTESQENNIKSQQSVNEDIIIKLKKRLLQLKKSELTEEGSESNEKGICNDMRSIDEQIHEAEMRYAHNMNQTGKLLVLNSQVNSGIEHLVEMTHYFGLNPLSDANMSRAERGVGAALLHDTGHQLRHIIELLASTRPRQIPNHFDKEERPNNTYATKYR